jgi:hypothetical protein
MGLLIVLFAYLITVLVLIAVCPLLYYFVTSKIVTFENRSLKNYSIYWALLIVSNMAVSYFFTSSVVPTTDASEMAKQLESVSNQNFLLFFITQIGLAMFVFKATIKKSFLATLAYNILFVLSFGIVGFLTIKLSLFSLLSA